VDNWRQARDFLLAAGFMDSVCADEVHFESRQKGFDAFAKGCSEHNKKWYYGGKIKRTIGKIIKKTGKAGKGIGKGIKKIIHKIKRHRHKR